MNDFAGVPDALGVLFTVKDGVLSLLLALVAQNKLAEHYWPLKQDVLLTYNKNMCPILSGRWQFSVVKHYLCYVTSWVTT
ncbi:MAG: hypothetical protein GPOALKHO_000401 [Sodalis sp.]|uniref:hypothetical protein n=1 Tax=Sodalis sp. (in: enterobacteria) TaxID=1898979 RepID=UPI003872C680|nr:MAG: hypothetical protein GPOALKHO_000401 [Sodalis sp.]